VSTAETGPVHVPPIGANIPLGGQPDALIVHGSSLGPPGMQAAAKANASAGNILTWMAVLCAGSSMAFFFSAIFVSSSFGLPYVISILATLAFGLAGDCATPKNPNPQPGGIVPPFVPPGDLGGLGWAGTTGATGATAKGFQGFGWGLGSLLRGPPPAFEEGQPVQLRNDGSSCFIDATFWGITALPAFKDALIQSCQEESARFTAWEKLGSWLLNHAPETQLTRDDLRLLIPLLSTSDFNGPWYNKFTIGAKLETAEASEALVLFDAQIKANRKACRDGQVDPELSDAVLDQILPLFSYDHHWKEQDVNTFVQLLKWIEAREKGVAPPAPAALESLAPILSRPEYEQRFRDQIESAAKEEKAPKILKDFVAQVNTLIESRGIGELVPIDAHIPTDPFFDLWIVGNFATIAQQLASKIRGIRGFLAAVATYDKTRADRQIHTNMRLSDLRYLLPEGRRQGQQDAADMLRALLDLIDVRKHPNLFFPLAMEQQYVSYEPPADNARAAAEAAQRLATCIAAGGPSSTMTIDGVKRQLPQPSYELYLYLPNQPAFGQQLFDQGFEFHEGLQHDPVLYKDLETGEARLYQMQAERFQVDELPDQFVLTLKRFTTDALGRGAKNSQPIVMPEFLTFGDDHYEVIAIVQHSGGYNGGHYTTLEKGNGTWWMCDDSSWRNPYVSKATLEQLRNGFTYGYSYIVRKTEAVVPQIENWPPAELPPAAPLPVVRLPVKKTAAPVPVVSKEEPPKSATSGDATTGVPTT